MKAIKCDRCKRYFEDELPLIRYQHYKDEDCEYQIDICQECFEQFIKFMKGESVPQI